MRKIKKPRKNEPRLAVEVILHKFYSIEVYDRELRCSVPEELDFVPYTCQPGYDYDYEEHSYKKLADFLPIANRVDAENRDVYDEILFAVDGERAAYDYCYPRLVGRRSETDEEYKPRIKKLHADYEQHMKRAEEAKKGKKKNEIEALEAKLRKLKQAASD